VARRERREPCVTYDPDLVEDWVVGATGFWRAGQVLTNEHIVPFRGTWAQVKARCEEMHALCMRHEQEFLQLTARHRAERAELWGRRS
jgi:hypothetical protein